MEIITKRPDDMSFIDYRNHLKEQKSWIKNRLKGELYYLASELYYSPEDKLQIFGMKRTGSPFRGSVKNDLKKSLNTLREEREVENEQN